MRHNKIDAFLKMFKYKIDVVLINISTQKPKG